MVNGTLQIPLLRKTPTGPRVDVGWKISATLAGGADVETKGAIEGSSVGRLTSEGLGPGQFAPLFGKL